MAAVAFDTLKLARALRTDAKMSAEQAEGIANALAEAMSGAELATKADVAAVKSDVADVKAEVGALRNELRAEIAASEAAVKAELRAEIKAAAAETKTDIVRWMFSAMVAQTALIVGLMAGLLKLIH